MKANYLASPPLVVAYALAGTTDIDLTTEPLGNGTGGAEGLSEGHLADATTKCGRRCAKSVLPQMFSSRYANVFAANETWNEIKVAEGDLYQWDDKQHLHPGAAVPGRHDRRRRADPADRRRPRAWRCSATP